MIYIIFCHAKALLADIDKTFWATDVVRKPLYDAGLQLYIETVDALERYWVSNKTDDFHRSFISSCMDFMTVWESWLNSLPAGVINQSSKVFHYTFLRFAKGILKAYRCWRIDTLKYF